MSAEIITIAELIEYAQRSSIVTSDFSDPQIAAAVARATDRIRQAALNDYTADSFESVTSANAPDELVDIALALALAILTKGDAARPGSIDEANVDAATRLGYIAAGRTYYDKSPGSVLVKVESGAGSSVSHNAPDRNRGFDTSSCSSDFRRRNPKI